MQGAGAAEQDCVTGGRKSRHTAAQFGDIKSATEDDAVTLFRGITAAAADQCCGHAFSRSSQSLCSICFVKRLTRAQLSLGLADRTHGAHLNLRP